MEASNAAGGVEWDRVREKLPSTAHELLDDIREVCERDPDDPGRAIERFLIARIEGLRERFKVASGGEKS
jgi:hypothetical protein